MQDTKKDEKKLEIMQIKEFVDQYLYERGISSYISEHPRYDSILWKISNFLRKSNCKGYSDKAKELLSSIILIEPNGSLILFEGVGPDSTIVTSKYFIDDTDDKVKRLRTEKDTDGNIQTVNLSFYNDDGIEEVLSTEQTTNYGKYFSKATRLPNRLDIIKIERFRSENNDLKKLEDVYQGRTFLVGLEDIYPDLEEVDPLDTMHFSLLGMPPIYEDLPYKIQKDLKENNGRLPPLLETQRQELFEEYKRLNEMYGRTKAFEKAMAKALVVKNNLEK